MNVIVTLSTSTRFLPPTFSARREVLTFDVADISALAAHIEVRVVVVSL
ncbi:MAG TPA: hypothetical protein VK887_13830 [Pseudonocardiaceae bacterium]|nr:hypothetical protein [Pseudonocardiaceae bacterium]